MTSGISQAAFKASPSPYQADLSTPTIRQTQPLCGNNEGWGPISSIRFDFTPCFLDVWISLVAVWGLLMGGGALWYLFNKRTAQPVSKNWHFYMKLVSLAIIRDVDYAETFL